VLGWGLGDAMGVMATYAGHDGTHFGSLLEGFLFGRVGGLFCGKVSLVLVVVVIAWC
jgi:hypothetical protein